MALYVDKRKNMFIDVPSNLVVLPKKFHLTDADIYIPEEVSLKDMARMIQNGDDTYREHFEWLKVVLKRLMLEDKDVHVLRSSKGAVLYEGAGVSRKPITRYQSRWILPTYQKSLSDGAADAAEDFWMHWVDEYFYAVLQFIETFPTSPQEGGVSEVDLKKKLDPKNPIRKEALGWIKELRADFEKVYPSVFPAKPKKETKSKEKVAETKEAE